MNISELNLAIAALTERVAALEAAQTPARDRGPKSLTTMTEQHAFDVKYGIHKDTKHKAAAEALGLSYGQIFSCRGGYTFKQVSKDWKPTAAATETVAPEAETQE